MSGIIIEAQKNLSTILLKTSSSDIIPRLKKKKKNYFPPDISRALYNEARRQ